MTDYEDYNNLAFPPQELSEVDILRAENERLKELLKECRYELEGEFGIGAANLVDEIDEVLK